ncbi:dihydroorotase [Clostridium botulinum]|nr:dihydroorotase [Clostridium botulinum]NFP56138.1 dihydroorotase [Clostridium botulinum]NFT12173.1 dihydroorotase [Clostridium botulinum]NFT62119.1 dihydroorotase [Clostridium botulinum]
MNELLIKNVNIIDWCQNFHGDVYIKNGIIEELGKDLNKNCEIFDGRGLTLLPSFIDMHAHFRDPGFTYKEDILTGSRAAVKGGYTMVNLMANTKPICSSNKEVEYVLGKGKEIGLVDIHQCMSITKDFSGDDISHLDSIDKKVKIISEDGKDVMNTRVLIEAMFKAKEKDLIVMCHSEEHDVTNLDTRLSENLMTWRNIALSEFTDCKVHIAHVSTKESMEYIKDAKKKGLKVTCEVAPHHIALTNKIFYRVNPHLREEEDIKVLIEAIKEDLVDCIGTDHAPHSKEDKLKGSPGISGIETSFSTCYTKLVHNNHISLSKLSKIMSKNPADILGVNKGEIKIGREADLVLVDTKEEYKVKSEEFHSKGKNTPMDGMCLKGRVKVTFKAGCIVYSEF